MIIFNETKSQPNTADKIIAGAKMVIPAANPRCTKNKIAAKVLVFKSNRPSKYSYAV